MTQRFCNFSNKEAPFAAGLLGSEIFAVFPECMEDYLPLHLSINGFRIAVLPTHYNIETCGFSVIKQQKSGRKPQASFLQFQ